jgi:acetate kinase
MDKETINILIINAGSSSIKFALYAMSDQPALTCSGKIDRIGLSGTMLTIKESSGSKEAKRPIKASDFHTAALALLEWLEKQPFFQSVEVIGHRIVHGMKHTHAEVITDELLKTLNKIADYDPDHLPSEIELIQLFQQKRPQLVQVACFDTAFHTTLPAVAKTFAIPKKYYAEGIQRYGFHGISFSYLMEELKKKNEEAAKGRIILAHLGSGASMAAVINGQCIDTTMGFTPAGGLVMGTRSGDLDPGIAWYLMQQGMDAKTFNDLINHQSGLLGISGTSADMKDLVQQEKENADAALAIDIYCYQVKKYIGAFTAALGGLDILVFSGGVGENAALIRSRICRGLEYAGINLQEDPNQKNETTISDKESAVKVYVIPTKEEWMIAKSTAAIYVQCENIKQ